MKQKIYFFLAGLCLIYGQLKAQAPNLLNYQGVARDITGAVIPDQKLGLRFTVHQGSIGGTSVYEETDTVTTNQFGLFTIAIGNGVVVNGSIAAISWGTSAFYLQVEMDPSGGSNYIDLGGGQLLSVPYALYSQSSGSATPKLAGGIGIAIDDSLISAQTTSAIWNANKLQGDSISITSPIIGQVLEYDGASWVPTTPNSGTVISVATGIGLAGGPITTSGTISIANTGVIANTYGDALNYPTFTVNAQGQLTVAGTLALPTSLPPSGTAGGDLIGTYPNPTVAAIQGIGVAVATPINGQILEYNGTSWTPTSPSFGTLTSVLTGTGLTGGPITSTGTISIANTGVVANSYGDVSNYPTFTVNAQGQLTVAGTEPLPTSLPPAGTAGGDLSGTYPNPSVAAIQGIGVAIATPTTGQVLEYNGTSWVPTTPAIGTLTSVTASMPLTSSGGNTPNISLTGIIPIANGGTNSGTALFGSGIMISNGTQIVQGDLGTTTTVLHGNASGAPSYSAIDLANDITGTLGVTNGGTGLTTVGANGTVLTITGGVPTWAVPASNGTVTSVATGIGLTGGPITSTGTISIANTGVTANSYGDASNYPTFTVNAQGQLTAAGTEALPTSLPPSGTAGGDLSGSYPNPTVAAIQGIGVVTTTPTNGQVLEYNGISWVPTSPALGSVSSVATGTGLTGGPITSTGTISIANTGVTASSYGDASNYPTFTVNAQGQLTAAGTEALPTSLPPSGTAGGDLSGNYPNPTVAAIQGIGVVTTSPTNGQVLEYNGTNWTPTSPTLGTVTSVLTGTGLTGGPITSTGTISIANTGVTASSYGDASNYPTFTVNAQGQLTAAGTEALPTSLPPSGSAGGDLSGMYPNPSVAAIQGIGVVSTSPTNGQVLEYNGTNWVPTTPTLGTLTSFSSGDLSPLFTTSVTNSTTTPSQSFILSNAAAYTILGNNTNASAAPAYFAPTLASALYANQGTATTVLHGNASGNPSWGAVNQSTDVTGVLGTANGGTGLSTIGANGTVLTITGGVPTWAAPATDGTVTSVGSGFGISGGPITTSGTLSIDTSREASIGVPTIYFVDSVVAVVAGNTWSLTGNSGTTYGTNFIGTKDDRGLLFKVDNSPSGRIEDITSGTGATAFGYQAMVNQLSSDSLNTAIGFRALNIDSGSANLAVGAYALRTASGSFNTAIGGGALSSKSQDDVSGSYNTGLGTYALWNLYNGSNNTASGFRAESLLKNGSNNAAYGSGALIISNGSFNTAMGSSTLASDYTGTYNTALGYNADVSLNNLTNATAIGANAVVSESNALVLGNGANVGIGTSTPAQALDVEGGNLQFVKALMPGGVAGTNGQVLQSNGANNAPTWVTPASGSVTSVGSGFGINGGPITTTGTLSIDTAREGGIGIPTIYYVDSMVTVAIASSGTVTSFSSGNLSPLFSTSVSNSTTTPTQSFTLSNAIAHTFFGNFSDTTGVPSFSSPTLASADFANQGTVNKVLHGNAAGNPTWDRIHLAKEVVGILGTVNGGTGLATVGANGTVLTITGGVPTWAAPATNGTVTNVGSGFGIQGGPITTTGTLSIDTAREGGIGIPTIYYVDSAITAAATGGTVTNVASGFGISGGPITTTGTLSIDTAREGGIGIPTIYYVDSMVTVAIASSGTVTSFSSGNLSPLFSTSVSNSTTTPSQSFTLSNATAHTFFGNFSDTTGVPSFSSPTLASADFANQGTVNRVLHGNGAGNPTWDKVHLNNEVANVLGTANGGTGLATVGANGNVLTIAGGVPTWAAPATNGTVTNVGSGFGIQGGPITTTGTLSIDTAREGGIGIPTIYYVDSAITAAATGGTVTNVASGFGISGGPITTAGTLSIDTAREGGIGIPTIYYVDSMVTVAIASSGTVTSFSSGNLSPLFSTSVSNSTTTPSQSFTLSNATAHTFFGNFSDTTGVPSFSSPTLASADFANQGTVNRVLHGNGNGNPTWDKVHLNNEVANVLGTANGGTGLATVGANGNVLTITGGVPTWVAPATNGTVTNVGSGFGISGGPITTTGTLSIDTAREGGIGIPTIYFVDSTLAAAIASAGTVTSFSSGNLAPLFTTSVSNSTTTPTQTFALNNSAAYTILGNNTNASAAPVYFAPVLASALYANQGTDNTVLHGNAAGNPAWDKVHLNNEVTNVLGTANGGTGLATVGSNGNVLTITGGVPTWAAPATNGTVTNVGSGFGISGGPITTTGTLSVDTARERGIGIPTIYFVDSTLAAAIASAGTVTSFSSGNLAPLFTTSVSNGTTTPSQTFTLSNSAAYTILGNNTNASAAPAYFAPVLASALYANQGTTNTVLHGNAAGNPDWDKVHLNNEVTNVLGTANGGTGLSTVGANGNVLTITGGVPTWVAPATSGTVTNVASGFGIQGGPITTTGTLSIDTARERKIGMPTIYFVDSTVSVIANTIISSIAQPTTQLVYGTGTGIASSSNLLYNGTNLIFHNGNIGIDNGKGLYLDGVADNNWTISRNTGNGKYVTSNAMLLTYSGNSNEGLIMESILGKKAFEVLGSNGKITFDSAYTFPTTDGTINQVLTTNGSGTLSWASAATGTVTNVASGFGIKGGPITTTGTLSIDTSRHESVGVPTIYFVDSTVSASAGWGLNGNSGTTYGTNFIGTTDNQGLLFEVDGDVSGRLETPASGYNTSFGFSSLESNSGTYNVGMGFDALAENTGSGNVGIGQYALNINFGNYNTAVGGNSEGSGFEVDGSGNSGLGYNSLINVNSGNNNTASGYNSAYSSSDGSSNSAFGANAAFYEGGGFNTAIGDSSLYSDGDGTLLTALGYDADVTTQGLSNSTVIGSGARVGTSNTVMLGNSNVTQLDINGSLSPWNGSIYDAGTAGYILQSNGAGVAPTWVAPGSGSGWSLTGNSGTIYGTNFIGTTDDQGIQFRINNSLAGLVEDDNNLNGSYNNTALGYQALFNEATISGGGSVGNVAIGYQALYANNDDNANISIYNVAIGQHALYQNVDGARNTSIGTGTMYYNVNGASNVAVGYNALRYNDNGGAGTANNNVAVGYEALQNNVNALDNVAVGYNALLNNDSDGSGAAGNNVGVGNNALSALVDGSSNTAIGANANFSRNDEGSGSIGNTMIGTGAQINNSNGAISNSTAIGYNSAVDSSNSIVLGNNSVTQTDFNGALGVWNSGGNNYNEGAAGQVLQSNGAGVAPTWVTAGGSGWSLTGNSGTIYGTNFIGNIDDEGILFKIDNTVAGRIEDYNPGQGSNFNTAFGYTSMINDGGSYSEAFGAGALANNTGVYDIGIGFNAMAGNTGNFNVGIGDGVLTSNQGGSNTAMGSGALYGNVLGSNLVAIGTNALNNNDEDDFGSAINNVTVGANSLTNLVDGMNNTALGTQTDFAAGDERRASNDNTMIGDSAIINNTKSAISNATVLGYAAVADSSNSVVLGNNRVTQTDFNGALGVRTGSVYNEGAAGQVLQSNGAGVAPTWVAPGSGSGWSLTGNSGTIYGTNFIGTTDDQGIQFRMNSHIAGMVEDYNTTNGGYGNTGLGFEALSQESNSGGGNTAIGYEALTSNQLTYSNVAVGYEALSSNDNDAEGNANNNVAIGTFALGQNVDGSSNTAVGTGALQQNIEANGNVAIGSGALANNDNDDAGTANNNVGVGPGALSYVVDGNNNTAIGNNANLNISDEGSASNGNTMLGASTLVSNLSGPISNSTAIGYNAEVDQSNTMQLGNGNSIQFDLALMPGGSAGTAGQVLQSNGAGAAPTWVNAGSGTVTEVGTAFGLIGGLITTTGTLFVDTSRDAKVGVPTIFYVDSTISASAGWSLTGNSGTTPGTNFIGTTDDNSLVFEMNATVSGRIEDGSSGNVNTSFGYGTQLDDNGSGNDAFGSQALGNNTGANNDAIGHTALYHNSGYDNVAMGGSVLIYNGGSDNTGVGYESEYSADRLNVLGSGNSGFGTFTLYNIHSGGNNTASGFRAGYDLEDGNSNSSYGSSAFPRGNGSFNTAMGDSTLASDNTGTENTALGYDADVAVDGLSNATAIGAFAVVDSSNSVMLGNNSVTQIDFSGALGIWNGTNYNQGTAGQVLQSNGADVAPTWVTAGGSGWSLTGNSGTTYGTNFIGTTDDVGLLFGVDGWASGRIEDGSSGNTNTAFGFQTMLNDEGTNNEAFGAGALANNTGSENIAIGVNTLNNNSGTDNIGIGHDALNGNAGNYNVGIGHGALDFNQVNNNTAVGYNTLRYNLFGSRLVAVGANALSVNDVDGLGLAVNNVGVGENALSHDIDGANNTAVGTGANFSQIDINNPSNNNTIIGDSATINNSSAAISNSTALGYNATVSTDSTVQLGNAANVQFDLALMPGGNAGTAGQVLQSNGADVAPTWVTPSGGDGLNLNYIGYGSGSNTLTGSSNFTYTGYGIQLSDGVDDLFIGSGSAAGNGNNYNYGGSGNIGIGSNALGGIDQAINNVAIGEESGNSVGNSNTSVGYYSLNNGADNQNTAIGDSALYNAQQGEALTALGYSVTVATNNLTNATAIGANSVIDSSNSVVLGNNSVTQVDFNGALGVWNGSIYNEGAAGQVLQSNGADVAPTWVTAGGSGWSLTGNSGTTAGTNFIGTTDSTDFVIATNDTERVRVTATGSVDIGTINSVTAPAPDAGITLGAGQHIETQSNSFNPILNPGIGYVIFNAGANGGTDVAGGFGIIVISSSGAGIYANVTFAKPYTHSPTVILTPADANTASVMGPDAIYATSTTTGFSINFGADPGNNTFNFNYMVIETQ